MDTQALIPLATEAEKAAAEKAALAFNDQNIVLFIQELGKKTKSADFRARDFYRQYVDWCTEKNKCHVMKHWASFWKSLSSFEGIKQVRRSDATYCVIDWSMVLEDASFTDKMMIKAERNVVYNSFKAVEDKANAAADRAKAAAEKATTDKAIAEKAKATAEKAEADANKARIDAEKAKVAAEKAKMAADKARSRTTAVIIEINSDSDEDEQRHGKKTRSSYVANVMDAVKRHAEETRLRKIAKRAMEVVDQTLEGISPADFQRCISKRGRIYIPVVDSEELTSDIWSKISYEVVGHVIEQFGGSSVVAVTVDDNGLILTFVVPKDETDCVMSSLSSSPPCSTTLALNLIDDYDLAVTPEVVFARMKHYFGNRDPGFTHEGSRIENADALGNDFQMLKKCFSEQRKFILRCQWETLIVFLFPPTCEEERTYKVRYYLSNLTGARLMMPENHAKLFGKIRQGREFRELSNSMSSM
jgi:hypothetical protein